MIDPAPVVGASLAALALVQELQPELPFVIVTGKADEPTAVNAMSQGAADFVHKERLARLVPVIHRELAYAVARHSAREHGLAVRRTLTGMFEVIERTVESRDTYTSDHHRRGAELCCDGTGNGIPGGLDRGVSARRHDS